MTTPEPSCCSGSPPPPTSAGDWLSARTGPSSSRAASCPGTPLPSACWTTFCTAPSSWSPKERHSACDRPGPGQEDTQQNLKIIDGCGLYLATSGDICTWPLTAPLAPISCDITGSVEQPPGQDSNRDPLLRRHRQTVATCRLTSLIRLLSWGDGS